LKSRTEVSGRRGFGVTSTLWQENDPGGEKEWEDHGKGYLAKSPWVEYPIGLWNWQEKGLMWQRTGMVRRVNIWCSIWRVMRTRWLTSIRLAMASYVGEHCKRQQELKGKNLTRSGR
jgi:hypothetical protein